MSTDEGELLAAVIGALRAGAPPELAWECWPDARVADDGSIETGSAGELAPAMAAAGRLARNSGVPLASILESVSHVHDARVEARLRWEAAIAGPKASAKVLAWLPVAGLALAALVDPGAVRLLVLTPVGWTLVMVAGGLAWAGRRWTQSLIDTAQRAGQGHDGDARGLPLTLVCALLAGAMSAGADVRSALAAVANSLDRADPARDALDGTARRLALGVAWRDAWIAPLHLAPVARALEPAWRMGASPVLALEAAARAAAVRDRRAAERSAAELGVRLVAPLTLCLLPSFVLVGIVPLLLAVASGVAVPAPG